MPKRPLLVIVAPETLPIPPYQGGAVQTVIYEQAKRLQTWPIIILSPAYSRYRGKERIGNVLIHYIVLPEQDKRTNKDQRRRLYLQAVLAELARLAPTLIHIHNRPQFVKAISKNHPQSTIILHLHNEHLQRLPIQEQKSIIKACQKIAFVSKYLQKKIEAEHTGASAKLCVVPNGIDTDRFKPLSNEKEKRKLRRKHNFSSKDTILLYVGRIVPEKGLHQILEILPHLQEKSGKKIKLLVIGSSTFGKQSQTEYERYVHQLSKKLKKQVFFTGYIDQNLLPEYYRLADIFVAPMTWSEPFGLVIGEAAASQLPVISCGRGAIPELIEHGKSGYLLPANFSKKELLHNIDHLVHQPRTQRQLGTGARQHIVENFSWEHSTEVLDQLYKQLSKT